MMRTTTNNGRRQSARPTGRMTMRRFHFDACASLFACAALCATLLASAASPALAQSKPLKIGGTLDMSSLYADITGPGSLEAAKMAAEDFGGEVLGRKIEVIAGDHLHKADLADHITRDILG